MNKRGLIKAAAQRSGLTQSVIQSGLEPILETILEALAGGDKVSLHNFGTFLVDDRPGRQARDPRNGNTVTVAAKRIIKFKAAPLSGIE